MTKREKELQKRSKQDLRRKLKLERSLARKMRGFFKRQNDTFEQMYIDAGISPDAEMTREELERILRDHYNRAAGVFAPLVVASINKELRKNGLEEIDRNDPELALALMFFISSSVVRSSGQITATSTKEANAYLAKYDEPTQAFKELRDRGKNRAHSIAVTENQNASEGSKHAAAESGGKIAAATLLGAGAVVQKKTWISKGDARVRPVHRVAHMQEVPLNEPFVSGGEFLMYPGDMSLGASPWNIVNCRCVSVDWIGVSRFTTEWELYDV